MNLTRFSFTRYFSSIPAANFPSLAIVVGLSLVLIGCGSGDTVTGTSQVRVFNAYIPAAGADSSVAVMSNGNSLTGGTNAPFGMLANNGAYVTVPSGKFSASGQPAGSSTTFTFLHTPTLIATDYYTIVAAGEAGQADTLVPRLITIPHISTSLTTIPSGDVAVRVVNVSLNPNPVGLYTTTSGTPVALDPGVSRVPYGYNSQNNAYVFVPATKLANLVLGDATTQQALGLSAGSNLTMTTFTAGQAYTLFVYGQPGNSAQRLAATWVADQASP